MEVDDLRFGIEEGEGGAPIPIAWLADRAGIDQVTRFRLQVQRDRFSLPNRAVFGTEAIGAGSVGEESALQVCVTEEGQWHGQRDERSECVAERNNVGVFIDGRTVNQLHLREVFERDWAVRQSLQPIMMLGSELASGPDSSGGGHGIEVIEFKQAGCGFIVIAADENFPQPARALDHLVGRSSIADHVAEVGYEIKGRSCRQAGFQGFEVGMNVAKQKYLQ